MFDVPVYLIACKNKKCCPDFVAARNIDSIPTRSSDSISAGNDESPIRNNDSISAGNDESENETENDVLFLESNDNTNNMNATTVCVCEFGFNVAFNNFSVISRRCLVATGSSMLTFIVLPH